MTQYPRKVQKVFGGGLSVPGNVAVIGSLQAGAVAYSGDIKTLQSLSNYDQGFNGVVVGNRVATMEEMTALLYVVTGQLAYALQSGIPEWDADTTYYIGNVVRGVGNAQVYTSLSNANIGHAVTDTNYWASGAYRAAARMGSNQVINVDGAAHKVNLNTPFIDPYTVYDAANSQFVAPVGGDYLVTGSLQVDNNTATASGMQISANAVLNGTTATFVGGTTAVANPPGGRWFPPFSGMVTMAAADTLEIRMTASDGVNSGNVTVSNSNWTITKV